MKVFFKYTSESGEKYKCISKTGSRYIYFIILHTNLNYFSVTNFGSQNIYKSILEGYFLFRVQKYLWSIGKLKQDKMLIEVYIIYGAMA